MNELSENVSRLSVTVAPQYHVDKVKSLSSMTGASTVERCSWCVFVGFSLGLLHKGCITTVKVVFLHLLNEGPL